MLEACEEKLVYHASQETKRKNQRESQSKEKPGGREQGKERRAVQIMFPVT